MSLSTTTINDRHASHRNGFVNCWNSSETISCLQIRLNYGLPCLEHYAGGLSRAAPKTKQSANSKKRCRWSGTAHAQESINKAVKGFTLWLKRCTKADDKQFENTMWLSNIRHHCKIPSFKRKHCIVSVTLICCLFGANVFSARENR